MLVDEIRCKEILSDQQNGNPARSDRGLDLVKPLRPRLYLLIRPVCNSTGALQRLQVSQQLFEELAVFVAVTDEDFVARHP